MPNLNYLQNKNQIFSREFAFRLINRLIEEWKTEVGDFPDKGLGKGFYLKF